MTVTTGTITNEFLQKNLKQLKTSFDLSVTESIEIKPDISVKHITFMLGDETFAAPVTHFEEIFIKQKIIPIPGRLDHFCGVINYKNRILPVINLHFLLGLDQTKKRETNTVFVTKNLAEDVAVMVDNLGPILPISHDDILPEPVSINIEKAKYILGEIYHQETLITILDLRSLII